MKQNLGGKKNILHEAKLRKKNILHEAKLRKKMTFFMKQNKVFNY